MTEAVGWLRRRAIDELGLTRLTARVFSFNRASARVLEKNGFAMEALLEDYHRKDGALIDALLFAYER